MKQQIYWLIYYFMVILQMIVFLSCEYKSNVAFLSETNLMSILLLMVTIYILSYIKSYIEMYKQELRIRNKFYILLSLLIPILYIVCFVFSFL